VLFRSRAERKLSFSVTTQDDGDHYVVLDNRRGRTDRDVSLEVAARRLRQGSDRPEASRATRPRSWTGDWPGPRRSCGPSRSSSDGSSSSSPWRSAPASAGARTPTPRTDG
jgi:hypothetical protein